MVNHKRSNKSPNYVIRIQGHFDPCWAAWFDDFSVTSEPNGDTLLTGYLPDQAALYGLIIRLQNMGITLLSVNIFE